jgi:hypothetical protein
VARVIQTETDDIFERARIGAYHRMLAEDWLPDNEVPESESRSLSRSETRRHIAGPA